MSGDSPWGGVPPVEPTPAVAPPVPVEAAPVVAPAEPRVDPYASAQPSYGPPPAAYTSTGYSVPPTAGGYYTPQQAQGPIGLSVASLVLGIAGLLGSFGFGIGLFPAIAGVITGHLGLSRQPRGRGLAIGGLITGYIGILFSLFGIAFLVIVIVVAVNDPTAGTSDYGDY